MMKVYHPTTPSRRGMSVADYSGLAKKEPERSLITPLKKHAGRSSSGRITVRHRGGGAKRLYRLVDFLQEKRDIPARVEAIEYDPNRTVFIALVVYRDGERRYILAPQDLEVGQDVVTSEQGEILVGNRMRLKHIPPGTYVHNVELVPGGGGVLARSAGSYAEVLSHEGGYTHLRLPSSEIRRVSSDSFASVGQLSKPEHRMVTIGKAGRMRWLGRRPVVRGSAMNPRDHPHGGGEGRAPIGMPGPKTPWGKPARGVKTRKRRKWSDKFIVSRRQKKSRI